jgi:hypothetical protein
MKLNAVPVATIRKAVISNTELFDCFDAHSTLASLKQVQTFIELVDVQSAGSHSALSAVARTVETHTCSEDLVGGGIVCQTTSVPLGVTKTPLAGCSVRSGTYPFAPVAQPSDPVAMATVPLTAGVVETVSVTIQVFDCRGSIGDLYLIAETGENVGAGHSPPLALGTRYEQIICMKDAGTATVQSCALLTPAPAGG